MSTTQWILIALVAIAVISGIINAIFNPRRKQLGPVNQPQVSVNANSTQAQNQNRGRHEMWGTGFW